MAKIVYNNKTYELKKKNLEVVKAEDALYRVTGLVEAYQKQYEYLKTCLGDQLDEILGVSKFEDIEDFDEITMLTNEVSAAYIEKTVKRGKQIINNAIDKNVTRAVNTAKEARSLRR